MKTKSPFFSWWGEVRRLKEENRMSESFPKPKIKRLGLVFLGLGASLVVGS